VQSLGEVGRVGPRLGPEVAERLVGGDGLGRQQLHPRALLGAELAQPQLAALGEPQADARGAVAHGGVLSEQLQAARAHQVHQQRETAGVEHQQLAATAEPLDRGTLEGAQRRVEGLERVDAGRDGRLDRLAGERLVETTGGDLHLGQLGHRP
jgi:hypothetical protein